MHFAEHYLATADGPVVYARDYVPEGVSRLPVLCLHGLTRNSADFEAVAPEIAALGRRVIAVDVRGRGKSDNDPDPGRYRPDVYVGDVLKLLDGQGIDRAVFVGTSMGGIMTMLTAVMAPGRVAAAVLNDVGIEVDPAGLDRIRSYVGRAESFASWDGMIADLKTRQNLVFPDADDAFWTSFARRVGRERGGRIEYAYDPAISEAFKAMPPGPPPTMKPLFEALAAVPVLLVRGALSDLLARETVAAMRAIKPDMEYVEVPDAGHAPTLEEPEARRAVAGFLARVP